jgi:hypothetical protein
MECLISHPFFAFLRVACTVFLFNMPRGFAALLLVKLLATVCSGFDGTAHLEGSGSLATLETYSSIRLLLRTVTWSAATTPEDNGKIREDTPREAVAVAEV